MLRLRVLDCCLEFFDEFRAATCFLSYRCYMIEHMFEITDWKTSASPGDPVAGIRAGLAALSAEDRTAWTSDSLSEHLVELLEVRERLDAELARLAAHWIRKRGWEADGALSPTAWLSHRAPLARPDARNVIKAARVVDASPALAKALATGATTAAHIGALARVMSPKREPLLGEHDEVLAKQAQRLSIKDFTTLARRWATLADDHLATDDHEEHRPRNTLQAGFTMDGWLDGRFHLDPVAGKRLLDTLDHLAPPDPADAPDGVRSLTQRRGDALGDLADWYHSGATPGGNPPTIAAIVDVATLNGDPPDLARGRCEMEGVGPVTLATLERIGCGAALTRLVMAGDSIVLDMGRKVRFATQAQARAVRMRDGGCVFPSCERPAQWCDIHHIDDFARGGCTDIGKLACLCARHHTLVHNSKWTIVANPDGSFTARHPTRAP